MLDDIKGLHHVTALASSAVAIDTFATQRLGLRRVKKTVNFDSPQVYHLYYGDTVGSAGSVLTHFPFPNAKRGTSGANSVAETVFAVPEGALGFWSQRLADANAVEAMAFGKPILRFQGPDGDSYGLVEAPQDQRGPWLGAGMAADMAIRGLAGVQICLRDTAPMIALLGLMGYQIVDVDGTVTRMALVGGNGADVIDLDLQPNAPEAVQGAGSVHHLAFAVTDRAAHQRVREGLLNAGFKVTPPINRDYFWAEYFRAPGGILFEIATHEPGFQSDESLETLGEALKLPTQHAHLRAGLEKTLPPLG